MFNICVLRAQALWRKGQVDRRFRDGFCRDPRDDQPPLDDESERTAGVLPITDRCEEQNEAFV